MKTKNSKDLSKHKTIKETTKALKKVEDKIDPEFLNVDPLKEAYHDSVVKTPLRSESLIKHNTALLVIDMQYLDAAPGHGVFADSSNYELPEDAKEYYFKSLKEVVIPNIQRLQKCFRKNKLEIIHTRIQSLTQDGRDRSEGHKALSLLAPPGSKEADFLEEIAPQGDEIVINKTASGVFTSTNLGYVLRNMNINSLYITGVYTNECVSTTARDARDLGYMVTLIEDSCTSVTPELHNFTITTLKDRYAKILNTQQAIEEIEQLNIKP